jgi:hypothetical protein
VSHDDEIGFHANEFFEIGIHAGTHKCLIGYILREVCIFAYRDQFVLRPQGIDDFDIGGEHGNDFLRQFFENHLIAHDVRNGDGAGLGRLGAARKQQGCKAYQ